MIEHLSNALLRRQTFLAPVAENFFVIVENDRMTAQRHVDTKPIDQAEQIFNHIRLNGVVAVDEGDEVAARSIDPDIASVRQPAVDLMDHFDALVLSCKLVAHRARSIRRTVVDQNDLQSLVSLTRDRVDAPRQIIFDVIDGNDHADERLAHQPRPPNSLRLMKSLPFLSQLTFSSMTTSVSTVLRFLSNSQTSRSRSETNPKSRNFSPG